MAQHHVLSNAILEQIINYIEGKHFTTITVVKILQVRFPAIYNEMQRNSPRNFQSVIGKATKRYATETNKIRQISPPDESPARWEKLF